MKILITIVVLSCFVLFLAAPPVVDAKGEVKFIGNSKSMKFHTLTCYAGKKISAKNKVTFDTRKKAVKAGYVPC